MNSGLDALKNRGRGERKKPIPPPRHSPRETPVMLPEPGPQHNADGVGADTAVASPTQKTLPNETTVVVDQQAPMTGEASPATTAAAQSAVAPTGSGSESEPIAPTPESAAAHAPAPAGKPIAHSNVLTEELKKKTISVGQGEEDFLRQVVVAGMLGKVDANQSATIRLALRRLQAEMTPEQVAEEIRRGIVKSGEGGRPRF